VTDRTPSARQSELLDLAYAYALEHGLGDLSLRPLAAAIGSSPRVLLYLFGSKDGLIRALLAKARADEMAAIHGEEGEGLAQVAERVWDWLAKPEHRALLAVWVEGYARSLVDPDGPWAGFARSTVEDWLEVLKQAQPRARQKTRAGAAQRTAVLALLRGNMLDLLATNDAARTTEAMRAGLSTLDTADTTYTVEVTPRRRTSSR
jgi:AcrR family transcriptional regulator